MPQASFRDPSIVKPFSQSQRIIDSNYRRSLGELLLFILIPVQGVFWQEILESVFTLIDKGKLESTKITSWETCKKYNYNAQTAILRLTVSGNPGRDVAKKILYLYLNDTCSFGFLSSPHTRWIQKSSILFGLRLYLGRDIPGNLFCHSQGLIKHLHNLSCVENVSPTIERIILEKWLEVAVKHNCLSEKQTTITKEDWESVSRVLGVICERKMISVRLISSLRKLSQLVAQKKVYFQKSEFGFSLYERARREINDVRKVIK